jgi:putative membrane protein
MKNRNLWIVIGVVVVAVVLLGLLAAALLWGGSHFAAVRPMMRGYRYPMDGFRLARGIGAFLFGLLIVGGGALLIAALVQWGRRSAGQALPPARQEESALEILRRRYARGEITREEYDLMKATLTEDTPTEGTS